MYYDGLINSVSLLAWVLVLWPAIFYAFAKAGWAERRDRILCSFGPTAWKSYFDLYYPALKVDACDAEQQFKQHYARYYGRRHFVIPVLALALVTGLGMWGTAETLKSWQTQHGLFSWPPLIVSGFLGAFTWVTSDQLSRLRRRDLGTGNIYNGVFRFLIAIPFGIALAGLLPKEAGVPVSFLIGVFPTTTLFTIGRRVAARYLKLGEDQDSARSDLEVLQNVGKENAERFSDEGVTTIAELAWTDPVDLTVRTNFDFNYVADCMAQALLAVYVGEDIKKIGRFSLRGAMEAASLSNDVGEDIESENPSPKQRDARKTLAEAAAVLNIDPRTFRYTLDVVAADPYTKFIWGIWGVSAPRKGSSVPIAPSSNVGRREA